jgi:phosphoribosylaminoimidazole-succinocarboxamide synthase
VKKLDKIYEGKAKIIYNTEDPDLVIQHFKDDATAFDGKKKGSIKDKGVMNNKISSKVFEFLEDSGIETHFVKMLNDREMLVKRLAILPIEVVVRNVVAGSLSKRMGVEEGKELSDAVLEMYYKDDSLGDPMINKFHVMAFELADSNQVFTMEREGIRINNILYTFFEERGMKLVDFKLEFGLHKGELILGDEISPDTCRLWDTETGEKMDKDRFRRDMGKVEDAYKEVLKRVTG